MGRAAQASPKLEGVGGTVIFATAILIILCGPVRSASSDIQHIATPRIKVTINSSAWSAWNARSHNNGLTPTAFEEQYNKTLLAPYNQLAHRLTEHLQLWIQGKDNNDSAVLRLEGHSAQIVAERKLYATIARMPHIRTICEIGFNAGHSASLWLLANPNASVTMFDEWIHPYARPAEAFLISAKAASEGVQNAAARLTIVKGSSHETIKPYAARHPGSCDIVSVDGDHRYHGALMDLEDVHSLVNPEHGLVFLDDTNCVSPWCKPVNGAMAKVIRDGLYESLVSISERMGMRGVTMLAPLRSSRPVLDAAEVSSRSSGEQADLLKCYEEVDNQIKNEIHETDFKRNQAFEIDFHIRNKWRRSSSFLTSSIETFAKWGITDLDQFRDKVVVDVGAGSRMRGAIFRGAKLVAIEPMAPFLLNYLAAGDGKWEELSHMDFYKPEVVHRLYGQAAEQRTCAIEGTADFVFCINALDHSYEPKQITANMARMLKPCHVDASALMLMSVDLDHKAHIGHPHTLTRVVMEQWFADNDLVVRQYWEEKTQFDVAYPGTLGTWTLNRRCK